MSLFLSHGDCYSCYGSGKAWDHKAKVQIEEPCPSCYGTGSRFTEVGHELVEMLSELFDLKPKTKP